MPDAAVNFSFVSLKLSFTRAASADTAAQLRHFDTPPAKPGQHVFELRQFHLHLAFTRSSVAGKNIKNELSAVNDARVHHFFNIALLRSSEVVIKQNQISRYGSGCARNLLQFAFPNDRCRIRTVPALQEFARDFRSRASC
jgi:hypothetical protein